MAEKNKYYSHLIVNKKSRFSLFIIVGVTTVITGYILANAINANITWTALLIPIAIIGTGLIAYPMTEHWVYEPWQNAPQKYEKNL